MKIKLLLLVLSFYSLVLSQNNNFDFPNFKYENQYYLTDNLLELKIYNRELIKQSTFFLDEKIVFITESNKPQFSDITYQAVGGITLSTIIGLSVLSKETNNQNNNTGVDENRHPLYQMSKIILDAIMAALAGFPAAVGTWGVGKIQGWEGDLDRTAGYANMTGFIAMLVLSHSKYKYADYFTIALPGALVGALIGFNLDYIFSAD